MVLDPAPFRPRAKSWLEKMLVGQLRKKLRRADQVIGELYEQIIEQKPSGCDGVLIDVKARKWYYVPYCLADDLILGMKNPNDTYVRQIFTKEEWEEMSHELGLYRA